MHERTDFHGNNFEGEISSSQFLALLWYSKVIVVLWQILLKNHVAGEGEAPAMFHDLTTH